MKTINLHISGKVQGVWYRKSGQNKAIELGLTGWIRNQSDGSVSAKVTGDPTKIEEFISWCQEGPIYAQVEKIIAEETALEIFDSFEIKRI